MAELEAKVIRRNLLLISAKEDGETVSFEFKLTYLMRKSSKKLTKAIRNLKSNFSFENFEVEPTAIYDVIKDATDCKLPGLIVTNF